MKNRIVPMLSSVNKVLYTKRTLLISVAVVAVVAVIMILPALYQFEWTGFGADSNKSVSIQETINPKDGKIIKLSKETEQFQSGKRLWDWLGLLGTLAIPVLLVILGNQLQSKEKEIADINLREEALQAYIDRMSDLLLDKNLRTLASTNPLRDAALDVARARTLSVLRRLDKDGERKGSIMRFLIDADFISKLELDLSDAHLEGAHLESAHLEDAHLEGAHLEGANLKGANLKSVSLKNSHLVGADLESASLESVHLEGANLKGAKFKNASFLSAHLEGADLEGADLEGANLKDAYLDNANLKNANLKNADLRNANLKNADFKGTINLTPEQIKTAKNGDAAKYDEDFRTRSS